MDSYQVELNEISWEGATVFENERHVENEEEVQSIGDRKGQLVPVPHFVERAL